MYTLRCIYIGYLFTFESPCVPDATQSTRTKDLASNYNLRKLLDGLKLVAEKEKKGQADYAFTCSSLANTLYVADWSPTYC